jgi:diguanylate cyclase (GGDEF)-like protein/PAS domain S-box-containing protein
LATDGTNGPEHLDDGDDPVQATLAWLRRAHTETSFGALDRDAMPVPVPAELRLPDRPIAGDGGNGLDLVVPEDRILVVRAWEHSRTDGIGHSCARLVDGRRVNLYFLNLHRDHGVTLVAGVPSEAIAPVALDEAVAPPPRVCTMRRDEQALIVDVDAAAVEMFGWQPEELIGEPSLRWIHPDDADRGISNWLQMLTAPDRPHRWRGRYLRKDGTWMWLDITNHNRLDDPQHGDVLSEMVDISDEMSVHETLREREQLLRELTDALPVGVVQFAPDRSVVHENEQLQTIVGAPGLLGLLDAAVDEDRDELEAALAGVLAAEVPPPVEVRLGGDRVCRVSLRPLVAGDGEVTGGLACVDDVTEEARLRRELEVRATFDFLTSCFSRAAILGALEEVADEGPGTGVVFVDLDQFKPINDIHGHAAGDELLATIGERLRQAVREVDMVGRLGGDEFLVVCPGVQNPDDVAAIARRVAQRVAEPVVLGGEHLVQPMASIGVAWAPAGTDPATLVARADAAMYQSKRCGEDQPGVEPNTPTKLTISPG